MSELPILHAATFQALFDTAPDAMLVIDASGRIVLVNPQAERLFGYPPTTLRGQSVDALVPQEVRAIHRTHRMRYVAQPRVRPMGTGQELIGLRHDGSQFPVEIALSPIETEDGRFYVASIRDISETQRARQALVRARYDALVAHVGRVVLESTSHDAAFESVPKLVIEGLGVDAVAIALAQPQTHAIELRAVAGAVADLRRILAELLAPELFPAAAHAARIPVVSFEQLTAPQAAGVQTLLGEAGIRDFIAVPLFDRGRSMGALVALAREAHSFDHDKVHFLQSVANLLAATVQRSRSEEQLAHAQRLDAIGQLTGGIAHDFNNLLTVVSGNLQLLESELSDRPQTQDIIASALRAVGRGADLTRKLLSFARRQRLTPQALNPRRQLDELGPMLTRSLGETVTVEIECASDIAEIFVDPAELDAAILNLALNARDAMPRGGILTITAHAQAVGAADASAELPPGNYVVISVRDTGHGMTPEVLARALEPFYTTKETGRGSGLGLSMVYGFVKQSGGHLIAESRLGYGTCIEMYLPVTGYAPAQAPAGAIASSPADGEEAVLVVEDEPEVRNIAIAFLHSLGYTTHAAADATQALQLLRAHPDIALLFSDVILGSGRNGGELAREAMLLRPDLPVLFTSGYEHPTSAADSGLPKSIALLRKPYRREDLAAAVRHALDRPRQRSSV